MRSQFLILLALLVMVPLVHAGPEDPYLPPEVDPSQDPFDPGLDPGGGLFGVPDFLGGNPTRPPLYQFDSSRPVSDIAYAADFDRVLDTPIFENQGGGRLTGGGVCYGYNLTTVDWFQLETRPRLRTIEQVMGEKGGLSAKEVAQVKRKDRRRLRAYSTDPKQRREIAKRVIQFQDDQVSISGAYTEEDWTEYIEAHPPERQEEIWQMWNTRIRMEPEVLFERLRSDILDPKRGLAILSIRSRSEDRVRSRPKPRAQSEEEQAILDEIEALEAQMAKKREEYEKLQVERLEREREKWTTLFRDEREVPPEPRELPLGGRGYPEYWGDSGHSLLPYRITQGTAINPEGDLVPAYRVRFVDPNSQETEENGADLDELNHLLYFPEARRWATSPRFSRDWHAQDKETGAEITYLDDRALAYSPIYEAAFVRARRISNEISGDVTGPTWDEMDFRAPGERPRAIPRKPFDLPLPSLVEEEGAPALPRDRREVPRDPELSDYPPVYGN